jgi:WD40 repeat protein
LCFFVFFFVFVFGCSSSDEALFRPSPRCVPTSTPDGALVSLGAEDGSALVWDAAAGGAPARVLGGHAGPVGAVAWNPRWLLGATACTNVCLWIPGEE